MGNEAGEEEWSVGIGRTRNLPSVWNVEGCMWVCICVCMGR